MRFKDVFSIIGPSMVGPSSSHTAGAVRLGRVARRILGGLPDEADVTFYGSFAETYRGHGTDLAIAAGLLDFDTDDARIRDALALAEAAGLRIRFRTAHQPGAHPNTARIALRRQGRETTATGCSIGGGNIEMTGVDGFDVKFTAAYPTLLVFHDDRPQMIARITEALGQAGANIGYMEVDRKSRSGEALSVIETDEALEETCLEAIRRMSNVRRLCVVDLAHREGTA